jgi:hypothetical protein
MHHQLGEDATHPIARFLGCPALLLLLAWESHAASSRLAGQPKKRTLGCVQSPFLGLTGFFAFRPSRGPAFREMRLQVGQHQKTKT